MRQSSAHPRAASNGASRVGLGVVRVDTGIDFVGGIGRVRSAGSRGGGAGEVA